MDDWFATLQKQIMNIKELNMPMVKQWYSK